MSVYLSVLHEILPSFLPCNPPSNIRRYKYSYKKKKKARSQVTGSLYAQGRKDFLK